MNTGKKTRSFYRWIDRAAILAQTDRPSPPRSKKAALERWQAWVQLLSNASQIVVCAVAIVGIWLVVIPSYQLASLTEAVTEKEMRLSEVEVRTRLVTERLALAEQDLKNRIDEVAQAGSEVKRLRAIVSVTGSELERSRTSLATLQGFEQRRALVLAFQKDVNDRCLIDPERAMFRSEDLTRCLRGSLSVVGMAFDRTLAAKLDSLVSTAATDRAAKYEAAAASYQKAIVDYGIRYPQVVKEREDAKQICKRQDSDDCLKRQYDLGNELIRLRTTRNRLQLDENAKAERICVEIVNSASAQFLGPENLVTPLQDWRETRMASGPFDYSFVDAWNEAVAGE